MKSRGFEAHVHERDDCRVKFASLLYRDLLCCCVEVVLSYTETCCVAVQETVRRKLDLIKNNGM